MAIVAGFTVSVPSPFILGILTDASDYSGAPLRADVGVFVKVFKKDTLGNRTSLTTTGNTSNPDTDTAWTFTYTTDGHYEALWAVVPDYNVGTTYALYDVAFAPGTGIVYRSLQAANIGNAVTDTAYWEVLSEPWLLYDNVGGATESLNATVYSYNRVLGPITKKGFADCSGQAALEACSDCKRSIDVEKYEYLGLAVDAMADKDSRQEYTDGEKIARRAALIIADC